MSPRTGRSQALSSEADLPMLRLDEGELHRFALTFDGYEAMGSLDRCAEIPERGH